MLDLASFALVALISRRELRFDPVPEQTSPEGCGLAVASALIPDGPIPARGAEGGALTLADLAAIAAEAGIRAYPRRLDPRGLDSALSMGFAPIVLHYARPDPHWALLLGKGRGGYEVGDPARGLELVDEASMAWRFSGAAMLVDPSSLDAGLSLRLAEARKRAEESFDFLAATGAGPSPEPLRSIGLGGSVRFSETAAGPGFEGRVAAGLDFGPWGLSLDLGLGASLGSGGWSLAPLLSIEKSLASERRFARLALSFGDDVPAASLGGASDALLAARTGVGIMVDPLLFFLDLFAGLAPSRRADVRAGFSLTAIEALSERTSLGLECAFATSPAWPAPRASLSLRIGFRTGSYAAAFGWVDSGGERGLIVEGEIRKPSSK